MIERCLPSPHIAPSPLLVSPLPSYVSHVLLPSPTLCIYLALPPRGKGEAEEGKKKGEERRTDGGKEEYVRECTGQVMERKYATARKLDECDDRTIPDTMCKITLSHVCVRFVSLLVNLAQA